MNGTKSERESNPERGAADPLPKDSKERQHSGNNPAADKGRITRRRFMQASLGVAGLIGFPTIIPASALGRDGKPAPSERIAVGLIGCGEVGNAAKSYDNFAHAELVALADPFGRRLETFKTQGTPIEKAIREYRDFRDLLASDVDAVHVATPDHWHVPMLLLAARAGKHVYLEKPLGVSIEQCRACREVIEEHPIKVQYGTQNRSTPYVRAALELILNGHLGEIKEVYVWCPPGRAGAVCQPEPIPKDLNYDLWLGPAPEQPYCSSRCVERGQTKGTFHIYDYTIGFVAGWGAHAMDQLQWWLDETGAGMPEEVAATGALPDEGLFDTLTHWDARLRYPGGQEVRYFDIETNMDELPKLEGFTPVGHGTLFIGTQGWVHCSRTVLEGSSKELLLKSKDPGPKRLTQSEGGHIGNFLDAIHGKAPTVTSLASAIRSDITCHLVDLAIRHGSPLKWDSQMMTITNNEAAREAMHRPMRQPWNVLDPKYA